MRHLSLISLLLLFLLQVRAAPYFATRLSVPGRIQAEDYDRGGPGVGYADTTAGNTGGTYRPAENVDIQPCTDGGFNVGWTFAGEWLKYSITVATAGTYRFELRVATLDPAVPIQLSIGGAVVGTVPVAQTGAWTNWVTLVLNNVALAAGNTELLVTFVGAAGAGGPNLNWIDVLPQAYVAPPPPAFPNNLDPAFFDQPLISGLSAPTDIAFAPDGRIFISEKQGTIRVWKNGALLPAPLINLIDEVQNAGDKGLLSIVLHPFFSTNNYIYLLFAVDPTYGQPDESEFLPVLHRLVRYTLAGDVVNPASRFIVLGKDNSEGLVSCASTHTGGKMRFAPDNTLMFTFGDGSHYEYNDFGNDNACVNGGFIPAALDIGSFRAQSLNTMLGKVLRIDPDTGLGIPTNPFYDATNKVRSRIWALGLRNPFRWSFKPTTDGTIILLVGDVGNGAYEEMDEVYAGDNMLWPCYEGRIPAPAYYESKPAFCADVATLPGNPRWPLLVFSHLDADTSYPVGIFGNAITSTMTYTGSSYPNIYKGAVFITEHTRGWVAAHWLDFDKRVLQNRVTFNPNAVSAVTAEVSPAVYNFDIFYLNLNGGQVRRIQYGNAPPEAQAAVFPTSGNPPLTVQFSSDGTFDSRNRAMTLLWEFGDGTTSNTANPQHTYTTAGNFVAKLTVTAGAQTASSTVTVNTLAPTPIVRVSAPAPFSTYPPDSNVQFAADLSGNTAPVTLSWELQLVHEAHYHPQTAVAKAASPSWLLTGNLPDGERMSYRVIATATNSQGFTSIDMLSVVPAGSPSGAPVADFILSPNAGAAPLPVTVDSLGSADPDGDLMFFTWDWGDDTLDAEGTSARHIYSYGGTYTITLTAMDNYGLKGTFTRQVTVTGAPRPPSTQPPTTQPPPTTSTPTTNTPTTNAPTTLPPATTLPAPSGTTTPPSPTISTSPSPSSPSPSSPSPSSPSPHGTTEPPSPPPATSTDMVFETLVVTAPMSFAGNVEIRGALIVNWTLGSSVVPLSVARILTVAPTAHLNVTINKTPANGELLLIATAPAVQGDFASASLNSPSPNLCTLVTGSPQGTSERLAILFQVESFCTPQPGHKSLPGWAIGLIVTFCILLLVALVAAILLYIKPQWRKDLSRKLACSK